MHVCALIYLCRNYPQASLFVLQPGTDEQTGSSTRNNSCPNPPKLPADHSCSLGAQRKILEASVQNRPIREAQVTVLPIESVPKHHGILPLELLLAPQQKPAFMAMLWTGTHLGNFHECFVPAVFLQPLTHEILYPTDEGHEGEYLCIPC